MRHLTLLATFLTITLAAPVVDHQSSNVSLDDSSWFNLLPKFGFFEDSSAELTSEHVTSTGTEDSVPTSTGSEEASPKVVFGNVTHQALVRLYLETDRQLRYWRTMAIMCVLSFYEHFAASIGSYSEPIEKAAADGSNSSLMTVTQMAQMMSSFIQNRFAQMVDYFK